MWSHSPRTCFSSSESLGMLEAFCFWVMGAVFVASMSDISASIAIASDAVEDSDVEDFILQVALYSPLYIAALRQYSVAAGCTLEEANVQTYVVVEHNE